MRTEYDSSKKAKKSSLVIFQKKKKPHSIRHKQWKIIRISKKNQKATYQWKKLLCEFNICKSTSLKTTINTDKFYPFIKWTAGETEMLNETWEENMMAFE